MDLKDFLSTLLGSFDNQKINYAVMRNYAQLPFHNSSGDIDVLIEKKTLPQIYNILFAINDISIVHITKRTYVHNIYIHNIKDYSQNSLQLDLFLEFEWYGIRYLAPQLILENTSKHHKIKVVSEYYEALILFYGKYIIHGVLKDDYKLLMQKVFAENFQTITKDLSFLENKKIIEDRLKLFLETNHLNFKRDKLKTKLFFHFFTKNPFKTICRYSKHISTEFLIRINPSSKYVLGLGNNVDLSEIMAEIEHTTKEFKLFKPTERIKLLLSFLLVPVYNHTTYIIHTNQKLPLIKRQFHINNINQLDRYIKKRKINLEL